jgi:gliding motility-associated-like protein
MKTLSVYLTVLLLLLSSALSAQDFYVCSGSGYSLKKVTLTPNGCTTTEIALCNDDPVYSVAIYNDTLFFVSTGKMYKATINSTGLANCTLVAPMQIIPNSLTVDPKGILYFVDVNKLYSLNPASGISQQLGTIPYNSAGDLVFLNGLLYMASLVGIVEVNISNPERSTLLIPTPGMLMYGLASIPVDCKRVKAYGLIDMNGKTDLAEIDLTNKEVKRNACPLPYVVLDAASNVETGHYSNIQLRSIDTRVQCGISGRAQLLLSSASTSLSYTYTLSNGQSNTSGVFENLAAGTYGVKITAPGGCEKDTLAVVPHYTFEKPLIQPHKVDATCAEAGKVWFDLQAGTGTYRVRTESDTFPANHTFTGMQPGTYRFSFLDENDCPIDSFSIDLLRVAKCDTVYFPSAFTPNGDNRNDVFRGSYTYGLTRYELQVFNRWGERVFRTTDVGAGWNGNHGSQPQPTGVYLWMATYTTAGGATKSQRGTTTLIR